MITYLIHNIRSLLLHDAPPAQVSLNCTRYIVPLNGTIHHLRRDRVCDCGGTPQHPCPAVPLIQEYLTAGGQRPPGHPEDTWPETWTIAPRHCPICDCPTVADRHLNSSHGPGWQCTIDPSHYWQVRLNPLHRFRATHPSPSRYPWYDVSPTERQAWLEAHSHLPLLAPCNRKGVTPCTGPKDEGHKPASARNCAAEAGPCMAGRTTSPMR